MGSVAYGELWHMGSCGIWGVWHMGSVAYGECGIWGGEALIRMRDVCLLDLTKAVRRDGLR